MFMKHFKKKLATGLLVASVVCCSNAFAGEAKADIYNKRNERLNMSKEQLIKTIGVPESVYKIGSTEYFGYVYGGGHNCHIAYEIVNDKVHNIYGSSACLD